MNLSRRDFFARLLVGQVAFMVLPAARTYRRTWRQLFCQNEDEMFVPYGGKADTVFDAFRMATESLSQEIYNRTFKRSPWLKLIRGEWAETNGVLRPVNTISELTLDPAWTSIPT